MDLRKFGCVEDGPEARSAISARATFGDIALKVFPYWNIADTKEKRNWLNTKRLQGNQNSCVGFAVADAIRYARLHNKLKAFDPSEQGIYNLGRLNAGVKPEQLIEDKGVSIYRALIALANKGIIGKAQMPYGRLQQVPSPQIMKSAEQRKLTTFYRIETEKGRKIDEIKAYIAQGWPVVIGTQVSSAMLHYVNDSTNNILPCPPQDEVPTGLGHAMLAYSYTESHLVVKNWWEKLQGMLIPWGYFIWANRLDAWCIQGVQN